MHLEVKECQHGPCGSPCQFRIILTSIILQIKDSYLEYLWEMGCCSIELIKLTDLYLSCPKISKLKTLF